MTNLARAGSTALEQPSTQLHVVLKVDGVDYVLEASSVLQMESFTGATPVPGSPRFVAGVMPVRGRVVPVIDLRLRFGLPAAAPTLDSRVVVGEVAERVVALLADSAREVVRIAAGDVKPPPALAVDGTRGFVKGIAQLGTRLVMVLDFAKVIGEESIDVG